MFCIVISHINSFTLTHEIIFTLFSDDASRFHTHSGCTMLGTAANSTAQSSYRSSAPVPGDNYILSGGEGAEGGEGGVMVFDKVRLLGL